MLAVEVNLCVGVQALEDQELMLGVEDVRCDIEGSLVGCVFGLVLVELKEVIAIVRIATDQLIIDEIPSQ